jgi:DNA polymerase-3 subunit delta'
LLFAGPARMGKLEVARALAARLLCNSPVAEPSPHPSPGGRGGVGAERETLANASVATFACGACRACNLLSAGTHPDFQFVSFEPTDKGDKLRTELVVEQIRRLGEWFSKTSQFGGAQVVVVEPAEMLNTAAANALLKTLEEPSGNRYLLLVSSRPGRLPATIRSRCQRLEFALPTREVALAWLLARGHSAAKADEALAAARGQPGLADAWIEQGGLALRAQVKAELDAVGRGKASPIETAQKWLADEFGEQRLRFAADLALETAASTLVGAGANIELAAPARGGRGEARDVGAVGAGVVSIATWFDALNRMRAQLPAPLRHDLILAGLLRDWRTMLATGSGPGHGGQQR